MKPGHEAGPAPHADLDHAAMDIQLPDEHVVAGEELGQVFPLDVFGEVLKLRGGASRTVIPVFFLRGMELVVGH